MPCWETANAPKHCDEKSERKIKRREMVSSMMMTAPRWMAIAESQFPWEREALGWLRAQLPDRDPWHVWTNFEFIDDEVKVNEVDALALSPSGLFLVEIKSRPGVVKGDAHTWTWETDGKNYSYDNPLILANRKATICNRQPRLPLTTST